MSLLSLLLPILVAGILAWAIRSAPFIDPPYKTVALWVLLVLVVLWLLRVFGAWEYLAGVRI